MLAAARVGGILANDQYPADFLSDNLAIEQSVIQAAYETGVDRLVFLGSTCIYPKHAPQPMPEDSLLTGPLEPTNQWYAVAKIAGVKLCEALYRQHGFDAISLMPTNLYGPHDNFDLKTSHVLPASSASFTRRKALAPMAATRRSPSGARARPGASSSTPRTSPTRSGSSWRRRRRRSAT